MTVLFQCKDVWSVSLFTDLEKIKWETEREHWPHNCLKRRWSERSNPRAVVVGQWKRGTFFRSSLHMSSPWPLLRKSVSRGSSRGLWGVVSSQDWDWTHPGTKHSSDWWPNYQDPVYCAAVIYNRKGHKGWGNGGCYWGREGADFQTARNNFQFTLWKKKNSSKNTL